MSTHYRYIRFFKEIGIEDVPSVGGKNASLGEMYRELTPKGVLVPNGFAITAQAYWYVLEKAGIAARLREALDGLQPDDVEDLARRGMRARELVYGAPLPEDLRREILEAYRALLTEYGPPLTSPCVPRQPPRIFPT
jgi:pyruvate,water dikinase